MKYTANYEGFTLFIEEVHEEGKDVCFEGKCVFFDSPQRELYSSGFWKLVGKFKHEVDNYSVNVNKQEWQDDSEEASFIRIIDADRPD